MGGIAVTRKTGPRSYEVVEAVTGGQLCEGRAASKIGVAAAGSRRVLGVAIDDAVPVADFEPEPVNGVLNANPKPNRAGLAYGGDEVPVKYAAACTFGTKVKAASLGRVTPMVAADDPDLLVGTCTEPAGITVADTVGLMRTV